MSATCVEEEYIGAILCEDEGVKLAIRVIATKSNTREISPGNLHRYLVGEVAEIGIHGSAGIVRIGTQLLRVICPVGKCTI